jgi:hypothetical protein
MGGVPPCDRRLDRRKVAIVAAAALFLFATVPASAGVVDFEIVQTKLGLPYSYASLTQKIDLTEIGAGVHITTAQFPDPDGAGPITGSDITTFYGNILADITLATIELVSGGQYTQAINNTPGVGGVPGSYNPFDPVTMDPSGFPGGVTPGSQYGIGTGSPVFLKEVLYTMHGDWVTGAPGPRPLGGGGVFPYVPGADFLINSGGRIAYVSTLGNDTADLVGDPSAVFGSAGVASPSWDPTDPSAGPLGTLTLPIESSFSTTVDLSSVSPGKKGTVTFTSFGVIKATPKIPEPSSMVLLGFGVVGLAACAWRLRKRSV